MGYCNTAYVVEHYSKGFWAKWIQRGSLMFLLIFLWTNSRVTVYIVSRGDWYESTTTQLFAVVLYSGLWGLLLSDVEKLSESVLFSFQFFCFP